MRDELKVLKREMEAQKREVAAKEKKFEDAEIAYDGLDDEEAEKPSNGRNERIVEKYHRAKEDLDDARNAARDIQTQIHMAVEELKRLGTPQSLTIEPRYSPSSPPFPLIVFYFVFNINLTLFFSLF